MTPGDSSAAAHEAALVVAELERGVLRVSGPDRTTWLNGVVTPDVAKVTPDTATFGLLLSKVGKIQSDFFAVARDDALFLVTAPGTEAVVRDELERMLVMEDAELGNATDELACLCLHGPRALEYARSVIRQGVTVSSLDRTGLGGAVVLCPRAESSQVLTGLVALGARLADKDDWERLRVERRIGAFGVDYGASDNPHEASLERTAISWTKGCYLGQEVVFMQDARGKVKRRLAQLELDGPLPARGAPVLDEAGASVGEVTSAVLSNVLGRVVALARVSAPAYEPGVRLSVGAAPATVRAEPV
jgi:folate-binding protein YgfZ